MPRAGRSFSDRLRRMLVMIPAVLESGGSTVADLAARFGVTEDEIIRDLNLVMCCGVPPYGGEQLITVMLDDDGSVLAWKGPYFNRPMRLTPTEGFAVLAAGKTLLAVPGAELGGALESALDKLETALGSVGSVSVELDAPPLLGVVRAAADEQHRLKVTHYSLRDEVTERVVDPWFVFSQEGRWYISGADSRSGEVRTFRIDRLVTAEPTGESFTRPPDARPPAHAFSAGPETTEVVLRLPGAARWVAEAYDALEVKELKDGELRIKLAVSGDRWLERLLLRVGPGASVVSPESFAGVGATAARRLLARYEG